MLQADMHLRALSGAAILLPPERELPLVVSALGWVLEARCGRLLVRSERKVRLRTLISQRLGIE